MVKEDFLHYLWKYKYFAVQKLQTTSKKPLQILHVGEHNFNSGPDFINANIRIGNQLWAGNVEIHVKSSDWYLHKHEMDANYDNVILHVVWIYDVEIYDKSNQIIPTLELNPIVSNELLIKYQNLFSNKSKWINCENELHSIDPFVLNNWFEVLYLERLERKSIVINDLLFQYSNDWEEVLFKLLTKNFGLNVNGEAFLNLANSIDFKLIRKERYKLINLESILFGQAGLLNEKEESAYYAKLQQEYDFIKLKYNIEPIFSGQFQFFRMRPNNFPTIRLAQLAMVYYSHNNLFSKIIEANSLQDYYNLFSLKISDYWQYHYSFTSVSIRSSKNITKNFIDLLVINTFIPLKYLYSKLTGNFADPSIIDIITQIKVEKNSIIYKFSSLLKANDVAGPTIENALESQSLLQLKSGYCDKNRCLHCAIGNALLKS